MLELRILPLRVRNANFQLSVSRCVSRRSSAAPINYGIVHNHLLCRHASFGAAVAAKAESSAAPAESTVPETSTKRLTLSWHSALTNPAFASKEAFRDTARSYSYTDIASAAYANHLKLEEDFKVEKTIKSKSKTLHGKWIAIFTPHDVSFVISLWSTWLSGGIAVPLGIKHPEPQLEYFLKNSDTSAIFCSDQTQERATRIAKACGAEVIPIKPVFSPTDAMELRSSIAPLCPPDEDNALILYTSGTTGLPKGVLWKHAALMGQVDSMVQSWKWRPSDVLLHVLPLYHLHGLINCLITPLSCGASVWMDQDFKAESVWDQLLSTKKERINLFMAVPTIYVKLLEYYEAHKSAMPSEEEIKRVCKSKMRLMVSGSAPLSDTVFKAWEQLTGHKLLERYGMTETGMILTNPLEGRRLPGTVGQPFPGVQTRIVPVVEEAAAPPTDASKDKSILGIKIKPPKEDKPLKEQEAQRQLPKDDAGLIGELQVSGANMFSGYWNNEKATRESFSDDGWFRTGDTATIQDGVYRLLGRTSTEIIKSGGYKISALDIERRLLEHEHVAECAVFGVSDPTWGERIVSWIQLKPSAPNDLAENQEKLLKILAEWVAGALPAYSSPKEVKIVQEIPRNAMGKINKKELKGLHGASQSSQKQQVDTKSTEAVSEKAKEMK